MLLRTRTHGKVRERFKGVGSLFPPSEAQGLNSSHLEPSPAEPAHLTGLQPHRGFVLLHVIWGKKTQIKKEIRRMFAERSVGEKPERVLRSEGGEAGG